MEKEFIPYAQALALKELGFDEPCVVYIYTGDTGNNVDHIIETKPSLAKNYNLYSLCISKPTFSQAFKWFREKYNLFGHVLAVGERNYEWRIQNIKYLQDRRHFTLADIGGGQLNNTYEEVELECLKKLIEITSGL